jgi:hypothetical protein
MPGMGHRGSAAPAVGDLHAHRKQHAPAVALIRAQNGGAMRERLLHLCSVVYSSGNGVLTRDGSPRCRCWPHTHLQRSCMKQFDVRELDLSHAVLNNPAWLTALERLLRFTLTYSLRPSRYPGSGVFDGRASQIVAKAIVAGCDGRLILMHPEDTFNRNVGARG